MKLKQSKIRELMERENIDICIVSSPENFYYITGKASHQHTVSRNPSMATAIFYKENANTDIICMDFEGPAFEALEFKENFNINEYSTWVGAKKWDTVLENKPEINDKKFITSFDIISNIMKKYNGKDINVGLELDYLPISYYNKLIEGVILENIININPLFIEARSIKTPKEIEKFRELTSVVDESLTYMLDYIKVGVSENQLMDLYKKKVGQSGICLPSSWSFITAGSNSSRLGLSTDNVISEGDIVKFDGGVNAEFDFYTTDTSRTYIMGDADPILVDLKQRLYEAQRLMINNMKPGIKISDIFKIGYEYVKENYPWYERGHLGHSISIGPSTAEYPIISISESTLLAEGMIFCVEVPAYIKGVGGYNIEDMVLIVNDGSEILTDKTPHFLKNEKRSK